MARNKEEDLRCNIPRHRVHTACLRQVITIQTQMPTMLGRWGLPVQLAWGKTTHTPVPTRLEKEFSIPECRLGKGVFVATPSSPSPHPSPKQLRKASAVFVTRKVQSKSLPGGRDPWKGPGTLGNLRAACSPLSRGATLNAAMPLPLACCQDGEVLTPPQDSSAPQLVVGILRATRIPGLHYMCTRPQSRLRRLLWSLAFLASAGLLATSTADRLHHLLSRPVHTRARLAWAPQLRFPAVTLCNPNRARFLHLTKPDLYSVGEWLGLARENHSLVPEMLAVLGEDQRAWLTRLANYSRFLPPRRSERTMQSFFHRLGHQIEDMLVECRFQGERCGPQDFTPVSSLLEGPGHGLLHGYWE